MKIRGKENRKRAEKRQTAIQELYRIVSAEKTDKERAKCKKRKGKVQHNATSMLYNDYLLTLCTHTEGILSLKCICGCI